MPAAQDVLSAASTAPSGSTSAAHLLSLRDRALRLGCNTTADLDISTTLDSTLTASADLTTTATTLSNTTLEATINTLTSETC